MFTVLPGGLTHAACPNLLQLVHCSDEVLGPLSHCLLRFERLSLKRGSGAPHGRGFPHSGESSLFGVQSTARGLDRLQPRPARRRLRGLHGLPKRRQLRRVPRQVGRSYFRPCPPVVSRFPDRRPAPAGPREREFTSRSRSCFCGSATRLAPLSPLLRAARVIQHCSTRIRGLSDASGDRERLVDVERFDLRGEMLFDDAALQFQRRRDLVLLGGKISFEDLEAADLSVARQALVD